MLVLEFTITTRLDINEVLHETYDCDIIEFDTVPKSQSYIDHLGGKWGVLYLEIRKFFFDIEENRGKYIAMKKMNYYFCDTLDEALSKYLDIDESISVSLVNTNGFQKYVIDQDKNYCVVKI